MLSIDLSKKIFSNGILEGHTSVVNSVGFNHDDTKIVSGSYDRTIRVWNVATGECILTLEGHTGEVTSVVFNHDGTKIVSGSWDNTIRVWNVNTGECILTLRDHTSWVNSVVFNHDGTKIVSGSYDETIRVWNVATGECILTLEGHTDGVLSVGFNHDGTKIVSGSKDNTIRVWNVDTGECIITLEGHTDYVTSVVFNHDGTKIVSGSDDQTIRVWDVKCLEYPYIIPLLYDIERLKNEYPDGEMVYNDETNKKVFVQYEFNAQKLSFERMYVSYNTFNMIFYGKVYYNSVLNFHKMHLTMTTDEKRNMLFTIQLCIKNEFKEEEDDCNSASIQLRTSFYTIFKMLVRGEIRFVDDIPDSKTLPRKRRTGPSRKRQQMLLNNFQLRF